MGNLTLNGSTSGQVTLTPPAVAGTNTITLPAATGTVLTTAGGQTISGTVTLSTLTSPAATNLTIQSAGTTAMTIDTSQNVGIGTSSPTAKLDIRGSSSVLINATNPITWVSVDSALTTGSLYNQFNTTSNIGISGTYTNHAYAFVTNNNERMRIDTSGNVGIGTVSPGFRLELVNGYNNGLNIKDNTGTVFGGLFVESGQFAVRSRSNHPLVFSTNDVIRATIDTSGNLLVGTTSSNGRLSVDGVGNTLSTYAVYVRNSTPSDLFYLRNDGFFSTGGAASSPYNATTATAANVVVASNGQLQRSTSSLKYKTDVVNATHGLAEVMQLRPVTYKGKNDGDKVFGGLIAEEVDAVGLTEFVQYAEDGSPDALAYGNMVSLLVKAIQEQQSIISDLQSRIAALEAK